MKKLLLALVLAPVLSFGQGLSPSVPVVSGWDDIQGPALNAGGAASLTQEAFGDTSPAFQVLHFKNNADEHLSFILQTSHRWSKTTSIMFHCHFVGMADPSGNQVVKISGAYTWANNGVTVPANASWTTFDVAHTVAPGDIRKPFIMSLFTAVPPAGTKESDFLLVRVSRLGATDSADTYSQSKGSGVPQANLAVLGCDGHYLVNKNGTPGEVP